MVLLPESVDPGSQVRSRHMQQGGSRDHGKHKESIGHPDPVNQTAAEATVRADHAT